MLQSKIRRGEMDRQVTFIRKVINAAIGGEDYVDGWTEIDTDPTVWAKKKELPGFEAVIDNQVQFMKKTLFVVDFRTDINTINRIVHDSKVYQILSVTENDSGRGTYLDVVGLMLENVVFTSGEFSDAFSDEFAT